MFKKISQEQTRRNDMPSQHHDTQIVSPTQVIAQPDDWEKEIVPRLPAGLSEHAKSLKAFERCRKLRTATDLLRGLLAYVYTVHSFQHLSIWSVLLAVADVSATDWRKRLQRASPWLNWLLQEVLASSTALSPWLLRAGLRRIVLADGTHVKCPGPQGMVWRIHTGFDLLAGRLTQLKVTDQQVGENLALFDLQPGDLVVTDRANGLRERIAFVCARGAQLIVRFTPSQLPLEDEQGKGIDVVRWLKGRHAPAGRICSRGVWVKHRGGRIAMRWMAVRLSEEQRQKARRRTRRTASKKQWQVRPDTLYLSGWILLLTTLPQEHWSEQQIACLYQARWHIELLFKRIKQLLGMQRLRCTTAQTAEPTITALLLGWALLEEESAQIRLAMHDAIHAQRQARSGDAAGVAGRRGVVVARGSGRSPQRMDGGRNQCGSLVPTDPRQHVRRAVSSVFAPIATLFVLWASQEAPSLHAGVSLAQNASDAVKGVSSDPRMARRLGGACPLKFAPMGLAPSGSSLPDTFQERDCLGRDQLPARPDLSFSSP